MFGQDFYGESVRRIFMPYCVVRIVDNSNQWIILNRKYKPLGEFGDKFIEYENHPSVFECKITEKFARKISNPLTDFHHHWPHRFYLYHDATNPENSSANMKNYMARLSLLAKKEIRKPW